MARSTKLLPPSLPRSLNWCPGLLARSRKTRTPSRCWSDATNRHEAAGLLTRSLAYVRKGGPLLMRACRCVSERRSRASAEVIGQYQSQPRDNHSCHASRRCVRACVRECSLGSLARSLTRVRAPRAQTRMRARARERACVIVAKLIISRAARCRRAYPVGLGDFQGERQTERERGKRKDTGVIEFAVRLDRRRCGFLREKRERRERPFWKRKVRRKFKTRSA